MEAMATAAAATTTVETAAVVAAAVITNTMTAATTTPTILGAPSTTTIGGVLVAYFRGTKSMKINVRFARKTNHIAKDCDWRYAENNSQRKKVVAAADTSYGVDTNWYVDSGATDHITNELEKVTMAEKYRGRDQVHNANGEGMEICHVGHSIVKTPHRNIHL